MITKKDLIGDVKDFPIEVVKKMVEHQADQGNRPDVTVFQENSCADHFFGGFDWEDNFDGDVFWQNVIIDHDWDLFFSRYPKRYFDDRYEKLKDTFEKVLKQHIVISELRDFYRQMAGLNNQP